MQPDFLKKKLGKEGEAAAADYLKGKGYQVLERNYRCRLGEVDLIAEKGTDLFFIEVKTRRSQQAVSPLELVPYPKQVHISKVAQHYMAVKKPEGRNGRFALIVVDSSGPDPSLEFYPDIFELAWGY